MRENTDLLDSIQNAHDGIVDWDNSRLGFEAKFALVAARYGFTIPQVTL